MGFLKNLFSPAPYPAQNKLEVDKLIDELIRIGKTDDYLSERPGGIFNMQCRHVRTRQIGKRLHDIGGLALMEYAFQRVRKKAGKILSAHLEYAWADVGEWRA